MARNVRHDRKKKRLSSCPSSSFPPFFLFFADRRQYGRIGIVLSNSIIYFCFIPFLFLFHFHFLLLRWMLFLQLFFLISFFSLYSASCLLHPPFCFVIFSFFFSILFLFLFYPFFFVFDSRLWISISFYLFSYSFFCFLFFLYFFMFIPYTLTSFFHF